MVIGTAQHITANRGGQAPEDHRYRTGLTHRASGWHNASPVMVEIPVRADQRPEAWKEAAPNHGRRDRPS